MEKKLKTKFVLFSMLAIFALLLSLLTIINVTNFTFVARDADNITLRLADNKGEFKPEDLPQDQTDDKPMGPDSKEMGFSMRYFAYSFDEESINNKTYKKQLAFKISNYTEDEALSLALKLLGNETNVKNMSSRTGWVNTYYRYRVYVKTNVVYVIVVDQARELNPSFNVLYISIIGGALGLILSFFILMWISNKLVDPFIKSERKQKRFIKDATRELNPSITVISENNELLKGGSNLELNKNIDRQLKKMTVLTKNMNTLLLLEDNSNDFVKENLNLSDVINNMTDTYLDKFKNIKLELDIEPNINYLGNEELLRKMLIEILENGRKYSLTYFKLELKMIDSRISLKAINDAKDLPEGRLDQIFERFYRYHEDKTGNGIGLSVVNEIVLNHNGRASAYFKDNTFTLKIDL